MKNAQKIQLMFIVIVALIGALLFERVRKTAPISAPAPVFVYPRPKVPERTPEFRRAPVKQYRPGRSHQMGVLTDDAGTTLPLYGKTVRGHRDRFHYWTTTGVTNLFSVPITHNDRDCVDDIGCPEFYGNETVSVLGKTGSFTVNLYRTDDFF
jgi:hypothetical protein